MELVDLIHYCFNDTLLNIKRRSFLRTHTSTVGLFRHVYFLTNRHCSEVGLLLVLVRLGLLVSLLYINRLTTLPRRKLKQGL